MNILDDVKEMQLLDKSNVYNSIVNLPKQCLHAYSDVTANKDFKRQSGLKNVIMSGMGGSGLAARVIKPLFIDRTKCPIELINSYHLPFYVDKDSLILVSSYSGNTEETLNTAYEALKRRAEIFSICSGGKLYDWSKKNSIPVYKIDPKYNACGQPRIAIGYSIFGQMTMLAKAGIVELPKNKVSAIAQFLSTTGSNYEKELNTKQNPAKQMAISFFQSTPVLVGSNLIEGALHVTKNQLNENAKTFATSFLIPELNHHLMEGLQFPDSNKQNLKFLFYESDLNQPSIQKRFKLTKEVVKKNNINCLSFKLRAKDKLTQAFEAIQFGAFWQYYLTMLYGIDPAPIPWVNYFKKHL